MLDLDLLDSNPDDDDLLESTSVLELFEFSLLDSSELDSSEDLLTFLASYFFILFSSIFLVPSDLSDSSDTSLNSPYSMVIFLFGTKSKAFYILVLILNNKFP
jgi:hypothetical protein